MSVRSPPLLVLSLGLLVSAGALGGLLLHDGEVGTDAAFIRDAEVGDVLRLKGVMQPAHGGVPGDQPPGLDHVARLLVDGTGDAVILMADFALPQEGSWVIIATVWAPYAAGEDAPSPPVLHVTDVTEPLVFE